MYANFYRYFGLYANPFNDIPDPTYLFLNPRIKAVLDDLKNAIQAHKSLIALAGEPGTGKTVLINKLRQWLGLQRIPTSFIVNPYLQMHELVELILSDFGISKCRQYAGEPVLILNRWLSERRKSGTSAILIVDEAQGLPVHLLGRIPTLLNPEVPFESSLQVILSGQPKLIERLKEPDLRPVRQLVGLQRETVPLSFEEAQGYIRHRIRTAGGIDGAVFTPEAIDAAYPHSQGVPRVLNLLCEHAMIRAALAQTRPIPACVMEKTAMDLQFGDELLFTGKQQMRPDPRGKSPVSLSTASRSRKTAADGLAAERVEIHSAVQTQREQKEGQTRFQREMVKPPRPLSDCRASHPKLLECYGRSDTGRGQLAEADSIRRLGPGFIVEETTRPHGVSQLMDAKCRAAVANPRRANDYTSFLYFFGRYHILLKCRNFAGKLAVELDRASTCSLSSLSRWKTAALLAIVPAWKRKIKSVVIWLNQPFPAPKNRPKAWPLTRAR